MVLFRGLLALLAILVASGAVMAQSPEQIEQIEHQLRAFDQAALVWSDESGTGIVRRWTKPIRYATERVIGQKTADDAVAFLEGIGKITGVEIRKAENVKDANFIIEFVDTPTLLTGNGRQAGCVANYSNDGFGNITKVRLLLNWRYLDGDRCMRHEMLHGFGLTGHPHSSNSLLSYTYKARDLTDIDRMALEILYDPRLALGMYRLPALIKVRELLVERILKSALPSTEMAEIGRDYIDKVVGIIHADAAGGQLLAQVQLGNAYGFGQYVQKDPKRAVEYWLQAAAKKEFTSQYFLSISYAEGFGVGKDIVRADQFSLDAARSGWTVAMQLRGRLLQGDLLGPPRPVEALAWLLAAEIKGLKEASADAVSLRAKMSADDISAAEIMSRGILTEKKP